MFRVKVTIFCKSGQTVAKCVDAQVHSSYQYIKKQLFRQKSEVKVTLNAIQFWPKCKATMALESSPKGRESSNLVTLAIPAKLGHLTEIYKCQTFMKRPLLGKFLATFGQLFGSLWVHFFLRPSGHTGSFPILSRFFRHARRSPGNRTVGRRRQGDQFGFAKKSPQFAKVTPKVSKTI